MNDLELERISVRFGSIQALTGVSLHMRHGEALLVAGPNGAGKSTLIQVLLGLIKPEEGRIKVDGAPCPVDNSFKRRFGYLPESVAFGENLTGREVLRFFAAARSVEPDRITHVLERVGLSIAGDRAVRGYSRGMRQRLGLAVAILPDPELLLFDEPTGGLDQEGISVLSSLIDQWRQAGRMILISSHDLTLFERKVDRVCLLRQGEVIALDSPAALREAVPWLPVRVTIRLAEDGTETAQLIRQIKDIKQCDVVSGDDRTVVVDVVPDGLRQLLNVQARFNGSIKGVRVEEPGLDVVYDSLLRNEVAEC